MGVEACQLLGITEGFFRGEDVRQDNRGSLIHHVFGVTVIVPTGSAHDVRSPRDVCIRQPHQVYHPALEATVAEQTDAQGGDGTIRQPLHGPSDGLCVLEVRAGVHGTPAVALPTDRRLQQQQAHEPDLQGTPQRAKQTRGERAGHRNDRDGQSAELEVVTARGRCSCQQQGTPACDDARRAPCTHAAPDDRYQQQWKREGKIEWGESERQAMTAALSWLTAQPGVDANRLGAFGFSSGGHTVTQVASRDQRLRAVAIASTPPDPLVHLDWEYRRFGALSRWPARLALYVSGMKIDEQVPEQVSGQIAPRPLLLVGGVDDQLVPNWMTQRLFAAAREPKSLFLVPKAGHGGYAEASPVEYPERLLKFFEVLTR